jgi:hypothetical protein
MTSIWQHKAVTVVVFPGAGADEVGKVLQDWTLDRLLGPFVWVMPEDITLLDDEPVRVNASVFGINSLGELQQVKVDLFQELARNEFETVRLVAVRVLRKNSTESEDLVPLIQTLARYVETSLPLPSARDAAAIERTRLYRINLVIAPTESHQDHYKQAILENWNLNVISSPEDRATPWSGDAFVRDDEKLPRFIAMHLATVGCLWNGVKAGPFEIMERENSQQGTIWVSRVFVNSVLTDGLSRRIAARALNDIGDPDSDIADPLIGISIPGTVMIPDTDADAWVDWMVEFTFDLDNKALTFINPLEDSAPEKERWFEFQQLKSFIVFSWDKLKVIPWWIWIWLRRKVGKFLTRVFQGKGGQAVVGIEQDDKMDSRDKLIFDKLMSISSLNAQAKRALITPSLATLTKTSPTLWHGIRNLVLSMLDGSNRQDFTTSENNAKIPVFSRVSQVIENPKKSWQIDEESASNLKFSELTWQNQENLNLVLTEYAKKLSKMNQTKDQLIDELLEIELQLQEFDDIASPADVDNAELGVQA